MATPVFVPIVEIKNVRCHPNAEKLQLTDALGWQVCIQKGKYKEGQKLIYFPPDTLLPAAWADKWNVRQYLKGADKSRVGSIKLRSEPSHGLLMDIPEGQDWPVGTDVSTFFGCSKYLPPVKSCIGDTDKPDDRVPKYTDIQNLRHYPDLFPDGEMVSVTEKVHGCLYKNTKIMLTNGEERSISEIEKGTMVLSYNEKSKLFESREVLDIIIQRSTNKLKWIKLTFDNGRDLICTENHKILTMDGWIEARDLTEKNEIVKFE